MLRGDVLDLASARVTDDVVDRVCDDGVFALPPLRNDDAEVFVGREEALCMSRIGQTKPIRFELGENIKRTSPAERFRKRFLCSPDGILDVAADGENVGGEGGATVTANGALGVAAARGAPLTSRRTPGERGVAESVSDLPEASIEPASYACRCRGGFSERRRPRRRPPRKCLTGFR